MARKTQGDKMIKNKSKITPIGTVISNMELIGYGGLADQASELRRIFIVKCLICENKFELVNRTFLRAERNKCRNHVIKRIPLND